MGGGIDSDLRGDEWGGGRRGSIETLRIACPSYQLSEESNSGRLGTDEGCLLKGEASASARSDLGGGKGGSLKRKENAQGGGQEYP